MTRRIIGLLLAAALTLGVAVPTVSAANPAKTCVATNNAFMIVVPGVGTIPLPIPSTGGCVSSYATGTLSTAAYVANCKGIEAEVGGYPYSFYGNPAYTAENRADCVSLLRGFHTGQLPPG